MTREIKFRAWDKKSKKMLQTEDIATIDFESQCIWIKEKLKSGYWLYFKDADILQYTGLKDKNGVEIYEGDVVHHGDPNIRYTVVFQDASFTCRQHGNRSTAGLAHWQERTEVISNIYEHPELIKTESE